MAVDAIGLYAFCSIYQLYQSMQKNPTIFFYEKYVFFHVNNCFYLSIYSMKQNLKDAGNPISL